MTTTKQKLYIESAEAVLGLHWFVARGDGLFAEEGLDVEILLPGVRSTALPLNDPRTHDHHLVSSMHYQYIYEENKVDIVRACEWGQIRRAYDSKRGCPIVSKRAAVVCQGIYVRPDSPVNVPKQLAGKTVGVQWHHGSQYSTLEMLEGAMPRDEINLINAGTVRERYEMLVAGKVDAATLMEPWISLAEKKGYKRIIETFYVGVENASSNIAPETYQALNRAIKKAVQHINADKRRYIHYLIEEMPPEHARQLTPDDFYLPRLRYVDPEPYTKEEFERAYQLMVRWDLIGKDADYDKLVCNMV